MPSLTRAEAVARAAAIDVSHYRITLDLTGAETEATFTSTTTISFTSRHVLEELFVDVKAETVLSVVLDGVVLDGVLNGVLGAAGVDGRLRVPASVGAHSLEIVASMDYSADGEGLHRHVDPADGRTYLYAMSFLDAGPRWFASFDQPDLKARYDVSVRCPPDWTVLGNGAATETVSGIWTLATTEPLATYFVTLVAGPYVSVVTSHDGILLGLHARASLAEHLEREAPDLLAVTQDAFDHYHRLFGIRYPFGDYHQAFVPDFNAGAMENPGCVTLRDQLVFRSAVTKGERGSRANTIVHELAHMWFGDLVTMTWWDDLWLNESFAEYMAHRVVAEITDHAAWSQFGISRKDWGYVADQSPSTHPVAGNGAPDAASALADFDGISYAKGAAVLKQLAAQLGDDVFLQGIRSHLADHAFGNATFADLVGAWERAGGAEVAGWADSWLRTSGLDTLTATVGGGRVAVTRTGSGDRTHAVTVRAYGSDGSVLLDRPVLLGAETAAFAGVSNAVLAVADAHDDTWAKIRFEAWDSFPVIAEPLTRVVVYNAVRDGVRSGELDPELALDLLLAAAETETDDEVLGAILAFALTALAGPYSPAALREARAARVAATAQALLAPASAGSDRQLVTARMFIRSTWDGELLGRWLAGDSPPPGLLLDSELRWLVAERLASLGELTEPGVDDELARDRTASGRIHAARARALRPDPAAKAAAWELLTGPGEPGAYVLYATAEAFFDPAQSELTADYVPRFFAELPATAEFRSGWSLARIVLNGYPSAAVDPRTLELARRTIADPQIDSRVRRSLVDATDALARALTSLERFA